MFFESVDSERGLYVGVVVPPFDPLVDYENSIGGIREFDRSVAAKGQGLVVILESHPNAPQPNSDQRARMANNFNTLTSRPVFFSVVATSPLVRGVMTAINWLSHREKGLEQDVHSTFEEAARWAESRRGKPLPELRALLASAKKNTSAGVAAPRGAASA